MPSAEPKLVRDLMTVGVVTCSPQTSIITIADAILEKDIEAIVVLDNEGNALGIVGKTELVVVYAQGDYKNLVAEDVMSDGLPTIPPDIPIAAAAQLMRDRSTRVFYLTHHAGGIEYPAAEISYKHLLRHLASKDGEEIKDLGIRAERTAPLDAFFERREATKNKNIHLE